jgi:hypothetical protein
MPSITLVVTTSVIRFVEKNGESQRQLTIRGTSPDIRKDLDGASLSNGIPVAICGVFTLAVHDTYAIRGVHQAPGVQANDFSDIYSLLERRPDVEVKFHW